MAALVDQLFPKDQADAIRKLWADKTSRFLLQQEIGKQVLSQDEFLDQLPLTQLMFLTSLSPFSNSEEECFMVASIICWGIRKNDILPMVTEHCGKELAYRCLISLGFFKNVLVRRWERHGAPSPSFYRNVGVKSFDQIGLNNISNHFCQWENFMGEFFV